MIDQKLIEQITAEVIRQISGCQAQNTFVPTQKSYGMEPKDGVLPDLTTKEMKAQITLDHMENREMMRQMKEKTPARIGIGNAGARL